MKIQIKEMAPGTGKWVIYQVSSAAVAAGRTIYSSFEEAERVACALHSDKEIEVIQ